ncbi:MAG: metallophosphoesterase family protein [Aeoliella sp.]
MFATPNGLTRREAIQGITVTAACLATSGFGTAARARPADIGPDRAALQLVRIGLVADVHQDVIHDGWARMRVFVDEMKQREVDALLQLGDFALPHKHNQPFIDVWNEYEGPKHHVLGNHDTDHGFSKEQTMKWWGMPGRHYSFDVGGWHFVVLDGNDKNPGEWSGYVRYVAGDQREWLAKDLAATDAPTMILSHQKLESDDGVANSAEVRAVLEKANQEAGWKKVYACLCGHHHTDGLTEIAGIRYIHVNSMSYKWVGGDHRRQRFPDHIEKAHPYTSFTCPYRDPLYTMLTLDPEQGTLHIEGKKTEFVPPTPAEIELENAAEMLPFVTARKLAVLEG